MSKKSANHTNPWFLRNCKNDNPLHYTKLTTVIDILPMLFIKPLPNIKRQKNIDSEDQVTKLCESIKNNLLRELPCLSKIQKTVILSIVDKNNEHRKKRGMVAGTMELIPNRFEVNELVPKNIQHSRINAIPYPIEIIKTTEILSWNKNETVPAEVLIPKIKHRFSVDNIVVPIEAPSTTERELDLHAMKELNKGRFVSLY
jgi:hypothetical protein